MELACRAAGRDSGQQTRYTPTCPKPTLRGSPRGAKYGESGINGYASGIEYRRPMEFGKGGPE